MRSIHRFWGLCAVCAFVLVGLSASGFFNKARAAVGDILQAGGAPGRYIQLNGPTASVDFFEWNNQLMGSVIGWNKGITVFATPEGTAEFGTGNHEIKANKRGVTIGTDRHNRAITNVLSVGSWQATPDAEATTFLTSEHPNKKTLVLQGNTDQTADLLQAQNSSGQVIAKLTVDGTFQAKEIKADDKLCIGSTCVTEAQLQALRNLLP